MCFPPARTPHATDLRKGEPVTATWSQWDATTVLGLRMLANLCPGAVT